MDPDMGLGSSSGLDVTMALVAAQATHISKAPAAARPENTNMVSGGCLDPEQRPWWPQELRTSDDVTDLLMMGHRSRHGPCNSLHCHPDQHGPQTVT